MHWANKTNKKRFEEMKDKAMLDVTNYVMNYQQLPIKLKVKHLRCQLYLEMGSFMVQLPQPLSLMKLK